MATAPSSSTERPWFGPRRFGWGWEPVTWEGWVATAVLIPLDVAAIVVVSERWGEWWGTAAGVVGVAGIIGLCIAKGTEPGGPAARRRFDAARRAARSSSEAGRD